MGLRRYLRWSRWLRNSGGSPPWSVAPAGRYDQPENNLPMISFDSSGDKTLESFTYRADPADPDAQVRMRKPCRYEVLGQSRVKRQVGRFSGFGQAS